MVNRKMNSLYLRKAAVDDCDLLYRWANDLDVRRNAFHTNHIPYEDHLKWFHNIISNENEQQYIMIDKGEAVGQVRLTLFGDKAEIHYSIDSVKRGKGYGKHMLKLLIEMVKAEYPEIIKLIGKVKPENIVSSVCFEKEGFIEQYKVYQLIL